MLEAATVDRLCHNSSHIWFTVGPHDTPGQSEASYWSISTYHNNEHCTQFLLTRRMVPNISRDRVGSGMTKDQLWHRLSGAPDLVAANLFFFSDAQHISASDQLKGFAQRNLDLLCTSQGSLTVCMSGVENSSEETGHGRHALELGHDADQHGASVWTIGGKRCITDNPRIRFVDIQKDVTVVMATVHSHPPPDTSRLAYLYPDSQAV